MDDTQDNSKCRLCNKRYETVNHIISECNILALNEYKNKNDWVGNVILWELCKKMKFENIDKWHMHKAESLLENETPQIL